MEGEDAFFAAPPADAPPGEDGTMDQGFAFVGEGGEDAYDAPPADDAFAAPPADDAFAAPPADDPFGAPPADDAFAAPPAEDTPIVLGAPSEMAPPEEPEEVPPPVEASAMKKFNEEWQATLNERQSEEDTKKAEMVEAARLTMEQFKKDREAKREAKMSKNREDEQAKLEAIEADLENDNSWQKVSKMVELTHDGAEDAEDVKRMRDVLILLKNEPSRAEAVGA
ncbi:unnamed protein product [Cylindrotheca closterium]|uniref:Clathrin light chain n=1 Tax=Cylindrotheca closterium TaxID=2856 RepID=A0AAD2G428_9STRA|nr:unnamed protein product [Cylindrotheca closterium]